MLSCFWRFLPPWHAGFQLQAYDDAGCQAEQVRGMRNTVRRKDECNVNECVYDYCADNAYWDAKRYDKLPWPYHCKAAEHAEYGAACANH